MRVVFARAARAELLDAVRYYETQRVGLGAEFSAEIQATIERIRQLPEAWQPLSANTRRCLTRRFPYGLIYQVKHDHLRIIAVSHLQRDPELWRDRL